MKEIFQEAYNKGGFRERYAMENGKLEIVCINKHLCFKFTYDCEDSYQDANGATYDIVGKRWID